MVSFLEYDSIYYFCVKPCLIELTFRIIILHTVHLSVQLSGSPHLAHLRAAGTQVCLSQGCSSFYWSLRRRVQVVSMRLRLTALTMSSKSLLPNRMQNCDSNHINTKILFLKASLSCGNNDDWMGQNSREKSQEFLWSVEAEMAGQQLENLQIRRWFPPQGHLLNLGLCRRAGEPE